MIWQPALVILLGTALLTTLLARKQLLSGQWLPTLLTLLLSLVIVLPLLYVFFTFVYLGFNGQIYETGMSLLILVLGLGLVGWGWVLGGLKARFMITSGVVTVTAAGLSLLP